jgi:hypothetical protein
MRLSEAALGAHASNGAMLAKYNWLTYSTSISAGVLLARPTKR